MHPTLLLTALAVAAAAPVPAPKAKPNPAMLPAPAVVAVVPPWVGNPARIMPRNGVPAWQNPEPNKPICTRPTERELAVARNLITLDRKLLGKYYDAYKHKYHTPEIRNALRYWCITNEILDDREAANYFRGSDNIETFTNDLYNMRGRWEDTKDTPLISYVEGLPSQKVTQECCEANRKMLNSLEDNKYNHGYHNVPWFEAAIQETNELYAIWDALRDSQHEYSYIHTRRQALARMFWLIKASGWKGDGMPPHTPYWRRW